MNNGVGTDLCSLFQLWVLSVSEEGGEYTRPCAVIASERGPHMIPSTQDLQGS